MASFRYFTKEADQHFTIRGASIDGRQNDVTMPQCNANETVNTANTANIVTKPKNPLPCRRNQTPQFDKHISWQGGSDAEWASYGPYVSTKTDLATMRKSVCHHASCRKWLAAATCSHYLYLAEIR